MCGKIVGSFFEAAGTAGTQASEVLAGWHADATEADPDEENEPPT